VQLLVKVRVDWARTAEFGRRLEAGELDRSAIRATYCLKEDPAVGFGIWEVADEAEFAPRFEAWRRYYESVEVREVVTPHQAMRLLSQTRAEGESER
jgi:hypothetical protein